MFQFDSAFPDAWAEQRWEQIRLHRSFLLAKCDWTQLADAPLTLEEKQAWQAYRQALRDIPQNFLLPEEVAFPTEPGLEQGAE